MAIQEFEENKEIGRGAFGFVQLVDKRPPIAAKWILRSTIEEDEMAFEREWKALKTLHHPNIVYFYGLEKGKKNGKWHHIIKMEYCEKLSLRNVIKDPTIVYNPKTVYCWANQLCDVLHYLAEEKIIHRDLKPENVLVTDKFVLKVADFGLVRKLTRSTIPTVCGTTIYMSPELLRGANYHVRQEGPMPEISPKSDLYAVGLILWEIVEREKVFQEYTTDYEFFMAIYLEVVKLRLPSCDVELRDIIMSCAEFDAQKRPSIQDLYARVVQLNERYQGDDIDPEIRKDETKLLRPFGEMVTIHQTLENQEIRATRRIRIRKL